MKINPRVFLQSTLLLALSAGVLAPDAVAGSTATVTVDFAGKVTGTTATYPNYVGVNDIIPANSYDYFSYNAADQLATSKPASGTYYFSGLNSEYFGLNVNTPGHTATAWYDMYLGAGSLFQVQMLNSGKTMELIVATYGGNQGGKSGGSVTLTFTSSTYSGLALPTATTISDFLLTSASLTWDPHHYEFNGILDEFNGLMVTPEPSSFMLLSVATAAGGIGLVISRRRKLTRV